MKKSSEISPKILDRLEGKQKKESDQDKQFNDFYYEFIVHQQSVQAVKELNLEACVVHGLVLGKDLQDEKEKGTKYRENFQHPESSKYESELNNFEREVMKKINIKPIDDLMLKKCCDLHKQHISFSERNQLHQSHTKDDTATKLYKQEKCIRLRNCK
jgi:hypothetical protein